MPDDRSGDARVIDAGTWAALLARWTAFARASVALPRDGDGERWRRSVAPSIGLQAVSCALNEVAGLAFSERAVGVDRAGVLIRRHAAELHEAWSGVALPTALMELIDDARRSHEAASWLGVEWVVSAPRLVMPSVAEWVRGWVESGCSGDVLAARAGTVLYQDEPAVFARGLACDAAERGLPIDGLERCARPAAPRQVYREVDALTGEVTGDLVAPLLTSLPAGRPLLATVAEAGAMVMRGLSAMSDAEREAQARVLGASPLPVRFEPDQGGAAG